MDSTRKIPEIPLSLVPGTPEAEAVIGFAWAKDMGKRSKIGGDPDWIQGPDRPACSCGSEMSFYGQLDSVGDSVCLADCGMVYVFICFDCFTSSAVLQSY
jgi:hypothetical protein